MDNQPPEQVISELLGPDERLLWAGEPRQGILLRTTDAVAIPFSVLWTGFMVFWIEGASRSTDRFFAIWGIPFLLIGLYMLVGRFFVDSWQRARTRYGVTSQRILIVSGHGRRSVKSLNLRTLSDVSLCERSDGRGTITFGPAAALWPYRGIQMPGMGPSMQPTFDQIPNARSVFDQIRRAQA